MTRRRTRPADPSAVKAILAQIRDSGAAIELGLALERRRLEDPARWAKPGMNREALERHGERAAARNPDRWGVDSSVLGLPSNADVVVGRGDRSRVVRARRISDAFTILHESGGAKCARPRCPEAQCSRALCHDLFRATERYVCDHLQALGVRVHDRLNLDLIDNGASDPITGAMIDAGRRIAEVHRAMGPASARLLLALAEPITTGEVRVWRALVLQETGERERHAQAACVRAAAENLLGAYQAIDASPTPAKRFA